MFCFQNSNSYADIEVGYVCVEAEDGKSLFLPPNYAVNLKLLFFKKKSLKKCLMVIMFLLAIMHRNFVVDIQSVSTLKGLDV